MKKENPSEISINLLQKSLAKVLYEKELLEDRIKILTETLSKALDNVTLGKVLPEAQNSLRIDSSPYREQVKSITLEYYKKSWHGTVIAHYGTIYGAKPRYFMYYKKTGLFAEEVEFESYEPKPMMDMFKMVTKQC